MRETLEYEEVQLSVHDVESRHQVQGRVVLLRPATIRRESVTPGNISSPYPPMKKTLIFSTKI